MTFPLLAPLTYQVMVRHRALMDVSTILPFHFPVYAAAEEYRRRLVGDGATETRTVPCYPGKELP